MPIADEGPWSRRNAIPNVMPLDIRNPAAHRRRIETEPLVIIRRPYRPVQSQFPSRRVFGAFNNVRYVMRRGGRHKMRVPRLYAHGENNNSHSRIQGFTDGLANFESNFAMEVKGRKLKPPTIRAFKLRIGRKDNSIINPPARIAAQPCTVSRNGKHDRKRRHNPILILSQSPFDSPFSPA